MLLIKKSMDMFRANQVEHKRGEICKMQKEKMSIAGWLY